MHERTSRVWPLTHAPPSTCTPFSFLPTSFTPITARGARTPRSVDEVAPSPSWSSGARPTGGAFRETSVGRPGGEAFCVCQGAPVLAEGRGRCRVRWSIVRVARSMAIMAPPAGQGAATPAMVAWDGAIERATFCTVQADTVAEPRDPIFAKKRIATPALLARARTPPSALAAPMPMLASTHH